jgi:hypothetical protein
MNNAKAIGLSGRETCEVIVPVILPDNVRAEVDDKFNTLSWFKYIDNKQNSYFLKYNDGKNDTKKIESKIFTFTFSKKNPTELEIKNLDEIKKSENVYCICRSHEAFIVIKVSKRERDIKIYIENDYWNNKKNDSNSIVITGANIENIEKIPVELELLIKYDSINAQIYSISKRAEKKLQYFTTEDREAIKSLLVDANKKCQYCGITQVQIDELDIMEENIQKADQLYIDLVKKEVLSKNPGLTKRDNRKTLEVDQKDPHGGYVKGNIVLACSWCNNAKTDTFTYDEFKNCIAPGIRVVWNCRLRAAKLQLIPEESIKKCCEFG